MALRRRQPGGEPAGEAGATGALSSIEPGGCTIAKFRYAIAP